MAEISASLTPYVPRSYFDAKGKLLVPVETAESAAKSVQAHVQSLPAADAELFLALLQEPDLAPRPTESAGELEARLDSLQTAVETIDKFFGLAEDVNVLATLLIKHGNALQKEALDSRLEARADAKNELMKQAGQMRISADELQSGAVTSLVLSVVSAAVSIGMSGASMRSSVKSGLALKEAEVPVAPTPPTPTPPANTPNPGTTSVVQTKPPPTVNSTDTAQNSPSVTTTDPSKTTPTSSVSGVEQPVVTPPKQAPGETGETTLEEASPVPTSNSDTTSAPNTVQSGSGATGDGSSSNEGSTSSNDTTLESEPPVSTDSSDTSGSPIPAQSGSGNGSTGNESGSNDADTTASTNQNDMDQGEEVLPSLADSGTPPNTASSASGNGDTGNGNTNGNPANGNAGTGNGSSGNGGTGNGTGGTTTTANKGSVSDADKMAFDSKKMEFEAGKMKFDTKMAEVHAGNSDSQHFSSLAGMANTLGQASSGYVSASSQAQAKMSDASAAEHAAVAQNILADADLAKDTQDSVKTFVSRMMDLLSQHRSLTADRFQSFTKV